MKLAIVYVTHSLHNFAKGYKEANILEELVAGREREEDEGKEEKK